MQWVHFSITIWGCTVFYGAQWKALIEDPEH
jgi:hypothetical protein